MPRADTNPPPLPAQNSNVGSYTRTGFVEVLAAQQSPDNPDWFQGTADAVRQYLWLFKARTGEARRSFLLPSVVESSRSEPTNHVGVLSCCCSAAAVADAGVCERGTDALLRDSCRPERASDPSATPPPAAPLPSLAAAPSRPTPAV